MSSFLSTLVQLISRMVERYSESGRRLSNKVYEPIHRQLYNAQGQVGQFKRPDAVDFGFWTTLEANGLAPLIPEGLRRDIKELYTNVIPNYDRAWIRTNEELGLIRRRWDERFGRPPGAVRVVEVDWWKTGVDPDYLPPTAELDESEALRLWDRVIGPRELAGLGFSLHQFIRQQKQEMQANPTLQEFRASHTLALTLIADVRREILTRIRH